MKSTFIEFKKDQYLLKEEESHIINCYFELKDNEKDSLFTSYGDERFIVKLDGYAIIPMEEYTKLNRPLSFLSYLKQRIRRYLMVITTYISNNSIFA